MKDNFQNKVLVSLFWLCIGSPLLTVLLISQNKMQFSWFVLLLSQFRQYSYLAGVCHRIRTGETDILKKPAIVISRDPTV